MVSNFTSLFWVLRPSLDMALKMGEGGLKKPKFALCHF